MSPIGLEYFDIVLAIDIVVAWIFLKKKKKTKKKALSLIIVSHELYFVSHNKTSELQRDIEIHVNNVSERGF